MNNMLVGLKQSKKAVEAGEVGQAYVAHDAESNVVTPFLALCKKKGIPVERCYDMKELAKVCKVEVPTAVAVNLREITQSSAEISPA